MTIVNYDTAFGVNGNLEDDDDFSDVDYFHDSTDDDDEFSQVDDDAAYERLLYQIVQR